MRKWRRLVQARGTEADGAGGNVIEGVCCASLPRSGGPPTSWPAAASSTEHSAAPGAHASVAVDQAVPSGATPTPMNSPCNWHWIGPHTPRTYGSAGSLMLAE